MDQFHNMFETGVTAGRGVSHAKVFRDFVQGCVLLAPEPHAAGRVEGIVTLGQAFARAAKGLPGWARAEGGGEEIQACHPTAPSLPPPPEPDEGAENDVGMIIKFKAELGEKVK